MRQLLFCLIILAIPEYSHAQAVNKITVTGVDCTLSRCKKLTAIASGVTIHQDAQSYYTLTCAHTFRNLSSLTILVNTVKGTLLKIDPQADLALISSPKDSSLQWVPVSIATESPNPGEVVCTSGYPRGDFAKIAGIVERYEPNMLWLRCTYIEGISGGPVSYQNKLVGIAKVRSDRGESGAVPLTQIRTFLTSYSPQWPPPAPIPELKVTVPPPPKEPELEQNAEIQAFLKAQAEEKAKLKEELNEAKSNADSLKSELDKTKSSFETQLADLKNLLNKPEEPKIEEPKSNIKSTAFDLAKLGLTFATGGTGAGVVALAMWLFKRKSTPVRPSAGGTEAGTEQSVPASQKTFNVKTSGPKPDTIISNDTQYVEYSVDKHRKAYAMAKQTMMERWPGRRDQFIELDSLIEQFQAGLTN